MSIKGVRTVFLALGGLALPAALAVVSYLLTAGSLGASAGRLPEEHPAAVKSASPSTNSPPAPAPGKDSRAERTPFSHESSGTGSGGGVSSSSDLGQPDDNHPEDEPGGGD